MQKTNAMRILDQKKIIYHVYEYEADEFKDGKSVAIAIGKDPKLVYKTIVCHSKKGQNYVLVLPVECTLDLKKVAELVNEKSVELLDLKLLEETTGYIRGGCSPIGMKKYYQTIIDQTALEHDKIIISGGRRGIQIELSPNDLAKVIKFSFGQIGYF